MNIATDFQTQQLALWKVDPKYIKLLEEGKYKIPEGINLNDRYVVIGEVEKIDHFIMLNMVTGTVLPGMYHLDNFIRVPEEDI